MAKLRIGHKMIIAANERTTLILRRIGRGAHDGAGQPIREKDGSMRSGYVLETYDVNIAVFDPDADGACHCPECARKPKRRKDKRHPPVRPLTHVLFEDEHRAHALAQAIGIR